MTEKELASGCSCGDNHCRRLLYECYASKMMGICYRYLGDTQISEDILHDGFIKIYESIHLFQYREEGSLRAWMSRIIRNIALDYLKKNVLKKVIPIEEYHESIDEISEEAYEPIPDHILMQLITGLPAGYRTVFNLHVFEGQSHKEIANTLGINESSSRSQLTRAKALLTAKVKNYIFQNG